MLLNLGDEGPRSPVTLGRIAGGIAAAGLLAFLVLAVSRFPAAGNATVAPGATFGTLASLGQTIYTQWLLPFEAVSLLLLVAIVGAVVVAKSRV
jgi:NADH-quinone oxidoreductase subunit J